MIGVAVELADLIPAGQHGKAPHTHDNGVHHQVPLDAQRHLALVSLVQSLLNSTQAGSGAAGAGVLGGGVVVIPLPPGKAAWEAAFKKFVQIFLVGQRVDADGFAILLVQPPADVIVAAQIVDKAAVGGQSVQVVQLALELAHVRRGQGAPLGGHGGGVVEQVALRLVPLAEVGGQLPGGHHHLPL